MAPKRIRRPGADGAPAAPPCPHCGAVPPAEALHCPDCGRPLAQARDIHSWVASIPLLTNRFILYDLGKVLGITLILIAALLFILVGLSGSRSDFWTDYFNFLRVFAVVIAGLAVLFLLVMLVFFGNRFVMRFQISAQGLAWETRMRRARLASRVAVIAGVLGRSPATAGAGLIAASQEAGLIRWRDVRKLRLHPALCTVSVMNRWRVVIRLFCTPQNYGAVVETLRGRLPHAVIQMLVLAVALSSVSPGAAGQSLAPSKPIGAGFNFFSEKEERAMGRRYAAELNRKLQLVTDSQVRGYVEGIGRRLEKAGPKPDAACEYQVVNTREVNAFAVPGGFIYVNRGLIDLAQSEDEVAAVVAHEIGHVLARHATRQISKQLLLQGILAGAVTAANAKSKRWADIAAIAGGVGTILAALKYSRNDEYQADALALEMLRGAGYQPAALVRFFDRMDSSARRASGAWNWLAVVNTHPPTRERIRRAELGLGGQKTAEPSPGQEEFAALKQTLAAIPLPPPGKDTGLSSALRQIGLAESAAGNRQAMACREDQPVILEREFVVQGRTVWLDTGIQLQAGDLVILEAAGEIRPIKKSDAAAGPDGLPGTTGGFWKPISAVETGALLARIEQDETRMDLVAGSSTSFCLPQPGKLKFGINDSNPFDNRGEFQVHVVIRRESRP